MSKSSTRRNVNEKVQSTPLGSQRSENVLASLYSSLMGHRLHQDNLLWSRTRILMTVQAAVIAGAYFQRSVWIGPAVLYLGAILIFVLYLWILRDQDDRDVNEEITDRLAERLLPDNIKSEISQELDRLLASDASGRLNRLEKKKLRRFRKYKARYVWFTTPPVSVPKWRRKVRGRHFLPGIVIFFALLDLTMAIVFSRPEWRLMLFP